MSVRDLLSLVLANLSRMRARVLLTSVGVMIGTAAVVLLISLGVGLQQSALSSLDQFGDVTQITVSAQPLFGPPQDPAAAKTVDPLTAARVRDLADIPNVVAVTPVVSLAGAATLQYGRDEYYGNVQGLDPTAAGRLGWQLAAGTDRIGRGLVVVGPNVFESGGESFRDASGRSASRPPTPQELIGRVLTVELERTGDNDEVVQRAERVRVAGVLDASGGADDYAFYVALPVAEDWNRWLTGKRRSAGQGYDQVLVKAASREDVEAIQKAVTDLGYQAFSALDILKGINQFALIIQAVLGGLGAVALLVAAFGIANTMTMAIYERTKEIGIMKALGATNRDVLRIFLAEAGAIGVLGGLVGAAIGWVASFFIDAVIRNLVIANSGGTTAPEDILEISVTPLWLLTFAVVFASAIGLLSGVYPALRAASMKPLSALRAE